MTWRDWLLLDRLRGLDPGDAWVPLLLRELSDEGLAYFRRFHGGDVLNADDGVAFDSAVFRAMMGAGMTPTQVTQALFPTQITFH